MINAFCDSAGLIKPAGGEAILTATDCLDRYLYVVITNDVEDPNSDPVSHVSRFITREAALIKNPKLAKVQLKEQPPRKLTSI